MDNPFAGIPLSLFAIEIRVDQRMVGSKHAYLFGYSVGKQTLVVSPAQCDLIKHAENSEELTKLMNSIPIKRIPFPLTNSFNLNDFISQQPKSNEIS
jgi:hypothetical protein